MQHRQPQVVGLGVEEAKHQARDGGEYRGGGSPDGPCRRAAREATMEKPMPYLRSAERITAAEGTSSSIKGTSRAVTAIFQQNGRQGLLPGKGSGSQGTDSQSCPEETRCIHAKLGNCPAAPRPSQPSTQSSPPVKPPSQTLSSPRGRPCGRTNRPQRAGPWTRGTSTPKATGSPGVLEDVHPHQRPAASARGTARTGQAHWATAASPCGYGRTMPAPSDEGSPGGAAMAGRLDTHEGELAIPVAEPGAAL